MTDMEPPVAIREVARRASEAGWGVEWVAPPPSEEARPKRLFLNAPVGRETRRIFIGALKAARLQVANLEGVGFLGSYNAIYDRSQGAIEAFVRPISRPPSVNYQEVPGYEVVQDQEGVQEPESGGDDAGEEVLEGGPASRPEKWRLPISGGTNGVQAEFSPATDLAVGLSSSSLPAIVASRTGTLKISGLDVSRQEVALRLLEEVGGSLLFNLDCQYGLALEFSKAATRNQRRWVHQAPSGIAPRFPRFRYETDALGLYRYARAADQMPLLQYLAYYQVLEYFYPRYYKQEQLTRMKQELLDPRFNVADHGDLARLMRIASPGKGFISEAEQLRATLSACVEDAAITRFIEEDSARSAAYLSRSTVREVPILQLQNKAVNIRDQVADRVYGIRCRIVHAKSDGGDTLTPLLLPGSAESEALGSDIELVRFLAQKTLVASATPI